MAHDRHRHKPWHRPTVLFDPSWLAYGGSEDGSPFAQAQPLWGPPAGLADPAAEYEEHPTSALADALDDLMARLSETERTVLEMRVAGLPFSVIAFEQGWLLPPRPDRSDSPDAMADKRKAHRIAARAARKLRKMIEQDPDLLDVIPPRPAGASI